MGDLEELRQIASSAELEVGLLLPLFVHPCVPSGEHPIYGDYHFQQLLRPAYVQWDPQDASDGDSVSTPVYLHPQTSSKKENQNSNLKSDEFAPSSPYFKTTKSSTPYMKQGSHSAFDILANNSDKNEIDNPDSDSIPTIRPIVVKNPLIEAVEDGNLSKVQMLLLQSSKELNENDIYTSYDSLLEGEDIVSIDTDHKITAFLLAASLGFTKIMELLLEDDSINLNDKDSNSETALIKAVKFDRPEIIASLVKYHNILNYNHRDSKGYAAIHYCCEKDNLKCLNLLLQTPISRVIVQSQGSSGSEKPKKNELSININLKTTDKEKCTGLIIAIKNKNTKIVEQLIKAGADLNIKDNSYDSVFDLASVSGDLNLLNLLKAYARARNQSYIFSQGNYFMEVVYENERSNWTGNYSHKYLSSDYDQFVSHYTKVEDGSFIYSLDDGIKLPASDSNPEEVGWYWLNEWKIDYSQFSDEEAQQSKDGWLYALKFDDPEGMWSVSPTVYNAKSGGVGQYFHFSYVRKRVWIRIRGRKRNNRLVPDEKELEFENEEIKASKVFADNTKSSEEDENEDDMDYLQKIMLHIGKVVAKQQILEEPTVDSIKEELIEYDNAIESLVHSMKTDNEPERKKRAADLATTYLDYAEQLKVILNVDNVGYQDTIKELLNRQESLNGSNKFSVENSPTTPSLIRWPSTEGVSRRSSINEMATDIPLSNLLIPVGIKPYSEWEKDDDVEKCHKCNKKFNLWVRRHHCRKCGQIFCGECTPVRVPIYPTHPNVLRRVCKDCNRTITKKMVHSYMVLFPEKNQ